MNNLFNAVTSRAIKHSALPFSNYSKINKTSLLCMVMLCGILLFSSCKKQYMQEPANTAMSERSDQVNFDLQLCTNSSKTLLELAQVRIATEKYKDISNAIADGYVDINVIMPNMGYHYQKLDLVDSVFDLRHPEFLVYNKKPDSTFMLVAVEYGIPLNQSVNAPEGFTGDQDVWDHNIDFGLWLLHAWVWKYNPEGVFNPTNSRVHVR